MNYIVLIVNGVCMVSVIVLWTWFIYSMLQKRSENCPLNRFIRFIRKWKNENTRN